MNRLFLVSISHQHLAYVLVETLNQQPWRAVFKKEYEESYRYNIHMHSEGRFKVDVTSVQHTIATFMRGYCLGANIPLVTVQPDDTRESILAKAVTALRDVGQVAAADVMMTRSAAATDMMRVIAEYVVLDGMDDFNG